jgi:hypothetical protein
MKARRVISAVSLTVALGGAPVAVAAGVIPAATSSAAVAAGVSWGGHTPEGTYHIE